MASLNTMTLEEQIQSDQRLHTVFTMRMSKNCLSLEEVDIREDPCFVDPNQYMEMVESELEARGDLKEMARIALDVMPDCSCDSIADALGLSVHTVRGMSNGRHKASAGRFGESAMSEYTREEILEQIRIAAGEDWS
jgi:hypothetical protein